MKIARILTRVPQFGRTSKELSEESGVLSGRVSEGNVIARGMWYPITHENSRYLAYEFYRGFLREKTRYGILVSSQSSSGGWFPSGIVPILRYLKDD
jgi:hypothetical protein